MLITDTLFYGIFFRLRVGQGVLSVPSAIVDRYYRDYLWVADWNEYMDIKSLDKYSTWPLLPIICRNNAQHLQLWLLHC